MTSVVPPSIESARLRRNAFWSVSEPMAVSDGNAAVAACLGDDPPDVVVLDMMLPKRSGFLVLEKIKGREVLIDSGTRDLAVVWQLFRGDTTTHFVHGLLTWHGA